MTLSQAKACWSCEPFCSITFPALLHQKRRGKEEKNRAFSTRWRIGKIGHRSGLNFLENKAQWHVTFTRENWAASWRSACGTGFRERYFGHLAFKLGNREWTHSAVTTSEGENDDDEGGRSRACMSEGKAKLHRALRIFSAVAIRCCSLSQVRFARSADLPSRIDTQRSNLNSPTFITACRSQHPTRHQRLRSRHSHPKQ